MTGWLEEAFSEFVWFLLCDGCNALTTSENVVGSAFKNCYFLRFSIVFGFGVCLVSARMQVLTVPCQ
jgi:hypothetical protein